MKPVSYRQMIRYIAHTPSSRGFGCEPLKECSGVRMAAGLFDQPEAKIAEDVEAAIRREGVENYTPYIPYP